MTVHVPVEVLARLGGDEFSWQVPALREELVTALIKSLPKDLRRNFVPAPDTARAVLASIAPDGEPILQALQRELHRLTRILVPIDAFDLDKLPPHLRVTFAVESERQGGRARKGSRGPAVSSSPRRSAAPSPRRSPANWNGRACARGPTTSTSCPAPSNAPAAGMPCAVSRRWSTRARGRLRVFPTAAEQAAAMAPGVRRLLRLAVPSPAKSLERALDPRARLVLGANPDGSLRRLLDDCADAATDRLAPAPVWTRVEFTALRDRVAQQLVPTTRTILGQVEKVLAAAHEVDLALPTAPPPTQADAIADIRDQLDRLMPKGFVTPPEPPGSPISPAT